jgi:hypothetical protein
MGDGPLALVPRLGRSRPLIDVAVDRMVAGADRCRPNGCRGGSLSTEWLLGRIAVDRVVAGADRCRPNGCRLVDVAVP